MDYCSDLQTYDKSYFQKQEPKITPDVNFLCSTATKVTNHALQVDFILHNILFTVWHRCSHVNTAMKKKDE